MRAVNKFFVEKALKEWGLQGFANFDDGITVHGHLEVFNGFIPRLRLEIFRNGSALSFVYAYQTKADMENNDDGPDNYAGLVFADTTSANNILAFRKAGDWVPSTTFTVSSLLRTAISIINISQSIPSSVPVPGPPGSTRYEDLTGVPNFASVALSGEFDDLEGLPVTLGGYGITDAVKTTLGLLPEGQTVWNSVFLAGFGDSLQIPAGTYPLSGNVTPPKASGIFTVDPDAVFTGGVLDMKNVMPIIGPSPSMAYNAIYKEVGAAEAGYYHVVGYSAFIKNTRPGVVTVGIYANGEAAVSGASVFGANFGCYVTAAGAKGIALELDSHVTVAGAEAYGLAIDSVGAFPSIAAIVIQNNNINATFDNGISFNNASGGSVITAGGAAIRMNDGIVGRFIYAPGITATLAEIELPSFIVGPTTSGANALVRIDASAAATPIIKSVGTSANSTLLLQGKGTGGVNLLAGDGTSKVRTGNNGIGFHGTAPVAKQSIAGSRGGIAALADLLSKLAITGLITDGTST